MADVVETWAGSGKTVVRDMTPEEAAQMKADQKAYEEQQAEEARQAETRAAAIAHAKSLGFTDDMIAVMYPGLAEN